MFMARIGIRGKILGFYGATLAAVVALEVLAQGAALRSGREFEDRLSRYHAIQGLRSELEDFRALGARYLRERLPEQRSTLRDSLSSIGEKAVSLERLENETQEGFFEGRAARRGIADWLPQAAGALSLGSGPGSGPAEPVEPEAAIDPVAATAESFRAWDGADRIAGYVDGYLGRLLSISMANGASRYREIAERSAESRRLALAGLVGAGTIALLFAALFASSLAAPIRRLAEASERMASGDLEVEPVHADTRDEVEILARGFNTMSTSIRALVEGLKEKAELQRLLHEETLSRVSMGRALREAQFMNLQDQIRPHFLFNALNTISRSALFEEAPATERLAVSLGALMRYSLADGHAFVTLAEELATLREYLSFQAIRFGPRLAWEIRSDPEANAIPLPRLSLQPLVENAVRHGIEPKVEGGRVLVSTRLQRGRVRLIVYDTGVGMAATLLDQLRAAAAGEPPVPAGTGQERPGIGLANLESRLYYRYGKGMRLAISSKPGKGTVVRISLPAMPIAETDGPDAV